jgi:uncharacterized protein YecA (UPF0149 family)
MTPDEILYDFGRDDIFPKAAMAAASAKRETMTPIFIEMIDRLAELDIESIDEPSLMALIPAVHLLAEWQEQQAYRPFLRMMRVQPERLNYLLGDAITETMFRAIAGTFDQDLKPLYESIDDAAADEFARVSLMSALVLITQLHPDQRGSIEEYLRGFSARHADVSEEVAVGWMESIVDLGLDDMVEQVHSLFETGVISKDYCQYEDFLEALHKTIEAGGSRVTSRYNKALITDAIDELSKWHSYSEDFLAERRAFKGRNALRMDPVAETIANLIAKVGRNDSCPCGSGKKFKKCCLH